MYRNLVESIFWYFRTRLGHCQLHPCLYFGLTSNFDSIYSNVKLIISVISDKYTTWQDKQFLLNYNNSCEIAFQTQIVTSDPNLPYPKIFLRPLLFKIAIYREPYEKL